MWYIQWEKRQAVPAGKLSAKEYQKEQDKYFEQLNGQVKKTARVLAAEKRAREQSAARRKAEQADAEAVVSSVSSAVRAAERVDGVPADKLSMSDDRKVQDAYFKSLDKHDHVVPKIKMARVKVELLRKVSSAVIHKAGHTRIGH